MMERKMKNRIGAGLNPGPGQFVPESSRPIAPMPQTDVKGKIARQMVCSHFTINALQLIVKRIEEIIKNAKIRAIQAGTRFFNAALSRPFLTQLKVNKAK